MKKQFFKTTSVKVYTTALATSLILLTGFTAHASDKKDLNNNAKISYVGAKNDQLTFNINFKNDEGSPFIVKLTDGQGQVWYRKTFTDKNLDKNILIENIGDAVKLNFSIISAKNSVNQAFAINTETKVVEDVVVTKM